MKTGKQRTNKWALSLIEVMVVITLIGLALGGMGVKIPELLAESRFHHAVEKVRAQVQLAQTHMLDYQNDVTLTIEQRERHVECTLSSAGTVEIPGIDWIAFDQTRSMRIDLLFDATVGATPEGKLTLGYKKESQTLHLKGFPFL